MKRCRVCGAIKPLDGFYRAKGCKDGYQNTCKKCKNKKAWQTQKKKRIKIQLNFVSGFEPTEELQKLRRLKVKTLENYYGNLPPKITNMNAAKADKIINDIRILNARKQNE